MGVGEAYIAINNQTFITKKEGLPPVSGSSYLQPSGQNGNKQPWKTMWICASPNTLQTPATTMNSPVSFAFLKKTELFLFVFYIDFISNKKVSTNRSSAFPHKTLPLKRLVRSPAFKSVTL